MKTRKKTAVSKRKTRRKLVRTPVIFGIDPKSDRNCFVSVAQGEDGSLEASCAEDGCGGECQSYMRWGEITLPDGSQKTIPLFGCKCQAIVVAQSSGSTPQKLSAASKATIKLAGRSKKCRLALGEDGDGETYFYCTNASCTGKCRLCVDKAGKPFCKCLELF